MTDEMVKSAAKRLFDKGEITEDEFNSITKMAGPWAWFKSLVKVQGGKAASKGQTIGKSLKGAGLGVAGLGAGTVVTKEVLVDPIVEANRINKSFDAMAKKVPQLAEKDKEDLRDYFGVIKTFSPKAASNPLVAGHLVNKMIEFGGVDHKLVQDIAAIQSGLTTPKVTQTALEAGAKAIAGSPGKES